MNSLWRFSAAVVLFILPGCYGQADSRLEMLRSASSNDPEFPDGVAADLVHFAHIGNVHTPSGYVHVVWQKTLIKDMLSPRGSWAIQYFNSDFEWIGRDSSLSIANYEHPPLFTQDSRLYFYGPVGSRDDPKGEGIEPTGNALDFSLGFEARHLVFEPRYGSWSDRDAD